MCSPSGAQVRAVFQQSGLSKDQLARIWTQVDRDSDGRINKQEFCEAMNYIRRQTQPTGLSNPSQVEYNCNTIIIGGRVLYGYVLSKGGVVCRL